MQQQLALLVLLARAVGVRDEQVVHHAVAAVGLEGQPARQPPLDVLDARGLRVGVDEGLDDAGGGLRLRRDLQRQLAVLVLGLRRLGEGLEQAVDDGLGRPRARRVVQGQVAEVVGFLAGLGVGLDEQGDPVVVHSLQRRDVQRQVARALLNLLERLCVRRHERLERRDHALVRAGEVHRKLALDLYHAGVGVGPRQQRDQRAHRLRPPRQILGGVTRHLLLQRQVQRQVAVLGLEARASRVGREERFGDGGQRLRVRRPVQRQRALLVKLSRVDRPLALVVLGDDRLVLALLDVGDHVILLLEFLKHFLAGLFLRGRHGPPPRCGSGPRVRSGSLPGFSGKPRPRTLRVWPKQICYGWRS